MQRITGDVQAATTEPRDIAATRCLHQEHLLRVEVQSRLAYDFAEPTDTIAAVLVAHAPGQIIDSENLTLSDGVRMAETHRSGNRRAAAARLG